MARKKQLIIPLFIPFSGCTHQCVFCGQTQITGASEVPSETEINRTIETYLETWERGEKEGSRRRREVAFYGGSFTALSTAQQVELLRPAHAYVKSGRLDALRVSTRPDALSPSALTLLKRFTVTTVELGVQSMNPHVLKLSGRGHTADDSIRAVSLLKEGGIKVGLQIMPGLPGDTLRTIIATAKEVAKLTPDFVRIYPTLVIRSTPLEELYNRGEYQAWTIEKMVEACAEVMMIFKEAGIPVIRLGLQPTEELIAAIVAGPFHPAFRDLVEKSLTTSRPQREPAQPRKSEISSAKKNRLTNEVCT